MLGDFCDSMGSESPLSTFWNFNKKANKIVGDKFYANNNA